VNSRFWVSGSGSFWVVLWKISFLLGGSMEDFPSSFVCVFWVILWKISFGGFCFVLILKLYDDRF